MVRYAGVASRCGGPKEHGGHIMNHKRRVTFEIKRPILRQSDINNQGGFCDAAYYAILAEGYQKEKSLYNMLYLKGMGRS